ncbi:MAG: hypothetical protein LAN70_01300 [Acidobacteriia bacterium]|nr:hypothetical protein [Terriglobia bacterium]
MSKSITMSRLFALVMPIKRCPRCGSHKVDRLPSGKPAAQALKLFGLHLKSCHDCLLRLYSWRH